MLFVAFKTDSVYPWGMISIFIIQYKGARNIPVWHGFARSDTISREYFRLENVLSNPGIQVGTRMGIACWPAMQRTKESGIKMIERSRNCIGGSVKGSTLTFRLSSHTAAAGVIAPGKEFPGSTMYLWTPPLRRFF